METILLILVGVIGRLVPHLPNATPVGAIALFGGARLGIKRGMIAVLSTMLITDLFLGLHQVMWATYGAFLLSVLIGKKVIRKTGILSIAFAAVSGVMVFFILTNFAVWAVPGSIYPKTFQGLITCYLAAIPFLRNQISADLFYVFAFFASESLAVMITKRKIVSSNYYFRQNRK